MPDASQEILKLNTRVDTAKEQLIRLQSRREGLVKNRDALVTEIRDAGYDPHQLKEERDRLKADLESKKTALEAELSKAEAILNSISA